MSQKHGLKNQRHCPALNEDITSRRCGSERGTRIRCPHDCLYSPYAVPNYDAALVLTRNVVSNIMDFFKANVELAEMELLTHRAGLAGDGKRPEMEPFFQHLFHFGLAFYRDSRGQTLAERWREQGFVGLTNDEQIAVAAYGQSYVSVVEVQDVGSDGHFWVTDVFRPESARFLVIDRAAASDLRRFSLLYCWFLPLPHYTRISGVSVVHVARETFDQWRVELERNYRSARRKDAQLTPREHLASRYFLELDRMTELGHEWRKSMLNSMDVCRAVARFSFSVPAEEIEQTLAGKAEMESIPPRAGDGFDKPWKQFLWVRRGESKALEKEMHPAMEHSDSDESVGGLATLRLYRDRLVIEALSRQKYDFARLMLERWFGARLRLEAEAIEDLAKMLADENERNSSSTESGPQVSPYAMFASGSKSAAARRSPKARPLPAAAAREAIERFHEDRYRRFLDEQIPMLGGVTPRQAAKKPALRSQLIELMKIHIHGIEETNHEHGTQMNLDWLLDELGLGELRSRG